MVATVAGWDIMPLFLQSEFRAKGSFGGGGTTDEPTEF